MPRPKKSDADKRLFLELYPKLQGNISALSSAVKVSRQTIYNWMKNDKELKKELDEINVDDLKLDVAENQLLALIKEKNFPAIRFFLENQGGSRGYGDKKEIRHTGEITLEAKKPKVVFKPSKEE